MVVSYKQKTEFLTNILCFPNKQQQQQQIIIITPPLYLPQLLPTTSCCFFLDCCVSRDMLKPPLSKRIHIFPFAHDGVLHNNPTNLSTNLSFVFPTTCNNNMQQPQPQASQYTSQILLPFLSQIDVPRVSLLSNEYI